MYWNTFRQTSQQNLWLFSQHGLGNLWQLHCRKELVIDDWNKGAWLISFDLGLPWSSKIFNDFHFEIELSAFADFNCVSSLWNEAAVEELFGQAKFSEQCQLQQCAQYTSVSAGRCQSMAQGSVWCCWAIGEELMARKFHLDVRKNFVTVHWSCTGTGCPQRMWRFPPWRYSRTSGHCPVPCALGWPCLGREVGPGDPPLWSLPACPILCIPRVPLKLASFNNVEQLLEQLCVIEILPQSGKSQEIT